LEECTKREQTVYLSDVLLVMSIDSTTYAVPFPKIFHPYLFTKHLLKQTKSLINKSKRNTISLIPPNDYLIEFG